MVLKCGLKVLIRTSLQAEEVPLVFDDFSEPEDSRIPAEAKCCHQT